MRLVIAGPGWLQCDVPDENPTNCFRLYLRAAGSKAGLPGGQSCPDDTHRPCTTQNARNGAAQRAWSVAGRSESGLQIRCLHHSRLARFLMCRRPAMAARLELLSPLPGGERASVKSTEHHSPVASGSPSDGRGSSGFLGIPLAPSLDESGALSGCGDYRISVRLNSRFLFHSHVSLGSRIT